MSRENGNDPGVKDIAVARKERKRRGRGRPTKLTPGVKALIVQLIQVGNYFETACAYAGIDPGTAHRWLRRGDGRDGEPCEPYLSFAVEVHQARALAEAHKVQLIAAAAQNGNWQAAAWWLERSFPGKWGRRDRLVAELEIHGEVEHTVVAAPPRSGERLVEMVKLAQELGIVKIEDFIDREAIGEVPELAPGD